LYYKLDSGVVHTIGVEICLNGGCIEEGIVGKRGFWLLIAYGINLRSLDNGISMVYPRLEITFLHSSGIWYNFVVSSVRGNILVSSCQEFTKLKTLAPTVNLPRTETFHHQILQRPPTRQLSLFLDQQLPPDSYLIINAHLSVLGYCTGSLA